MEAYYDTVLNITWLADANAGAGSPYDNAAADTFGERNDTTDGLMTWNDAQAWITHLNTINYLGVYDWRLPTVTDTGTPGCNFAYTGTDCGYNVDLTTGELAHMFYSTLGNTGYYDTSGGLAGCSDSPPYCLTNTGPFSNVQTGYPDWSGTEDPADTHPVNPVAYVWMFDFAFGSQGYRNKPNGLYAWPVHPGDIGVVPIPPTVWLLGTALAGLGGRRWLKRKISS